MSKMIFYILVLFQLYHACIPFLRFGKYHVWWFPWYKYRYMVILLFATTTRRLSMQAEFGQKTRGLKSVDFTTMETKYRRTRERRSKRKKQDEKHHVIGKCDIPRKVQQKEPGRSPGRSARLVWHLTSLSLYTELITVMQRAQYYSNKARERD